VCKTALDAASPERVLAMGYSITRVNGRVVRSLDDVAVGDRVSTSVAGGEFTSIVEDKQK
jgi:exodeoxyribonuclease VII large subunit